MPALHCISSFEKVFSVKSYKDIGGEIHGSLLVTFYSLLVTFYSLLSPRYSLLLTCYSLLVTLYSLLFIGAVFHFIHVSVNVHCYPAIRKETPELTLSEKFQDCSVTQYPVKSRLPDIFETAGFPAKVYLCALSQHCLCNVASDVFGQNWLNNIPTLCYSSMIDTVLQIFTS